MTRENVHDKGRRLLVEGRLTVLKVGVELEAECRGDSGEVYCLGWNGQWHCDCPASTRCSHLVALQLVTLRPRARERTWADRQQVGA